MRSQNARARMHPSIVLGQDKNCRSLHGTPGQVGFARDDKKERVVVRRWRLLKEGVANGFPAPTTVLSFGNDPLLTTTLPYLSSRAKPTCLGVPWRDLQSLYPHS